MLYEVVYDSIYTNETSVERWDRNIERALPKSARKRCKVTPTARISSQISLALPSREKMAPLSFDAKLNGLQNAKKTFLADQVCTSQKAKILIFAYGQKHRSSMAFTLFRIHLGYGPRRLLSRFVAALTSFRMISKSNWNRQRKVEKKSKMIFRRCRQFFSIFDECFRHINPISITTSTIALIFFVMV